MPENTTRVPVLIVGAGPTGLLLAAELRRRGVACRLVDARDGPNHWDRATAIHVRSLEIFASLGLIDRFLDAGTKHRSIVLYSDGELLGTLDLSECGGDIGFGLGLSEEVTESILTDYLEACGGNVERSTKLVAAQIAGDGVSAELERHGSRYRIEADWLVGCDGAHSITRELSGAVLEGHDIAEPWAVFDAAIDGWSGGFELNAGYLDALPVILNALPERRWRVYLRPSSPDSNLLDDAAGTLQRYVPGMSFAGVANPARFHCSNKAADRFRSGRALLAGDAAHLCTPGQGHGMNAGVQDAFNLAWKLALVCDGLADASLLDSYDAERRPVAQLVARSGETAEASQTLADSVARKKRNDSIRAMLADPALRLNEIVAETELNVEYSQSPIVLGGGQRLTGVAPVRATGHTLVLAGDATLLPALQKIVAASRVFESAVTVDRSRIPGGSDGSTLLAVRPDGYVGMRSDRNYLGDLERYRSLLSLR